MAKFKNCLNNTKSWGIGVHIAWRNEKDVTFLAYRYVVFISRALLHIENDLMRAQWDSLLLLTHSFFCQLFFVSANYSCRVQFFFFNFNFSVDLRYASERKSEVLSWQNSLN